jgi:hypothetical protein
VNSIVNFEHDVKDPSSFRSESVVILYLQTHKQRGLRQVRKCMLGVRIPEVSHSLMQSS